MCTPVIESETENNIPPSSFDREVHVLLGRKLSKILKLNFGHVILPEFNMLNMFNISEEHSAHYPAKFEHAAAP